MSSFTPVNPQWRLQQPDCSKRYWFGPDKYANHESIKHISYEKVDKTISESEQQCYLKEKLSRRLITISTFSEAGESKQGDSGICLASDDSRESTTESIVTTSKIILTSDILPTSRRRQSCQDLPQDLDMSSSYIKESTELLRQSLSSLTMTSCKKRLLSPPQDFSKPSGFQSMTKKRKILVVVPVLDKKATRSFKSRRSHPYNTRSRGHEESHLHARSEHSTLTLSKEQEYEQSRNKVSQKNYKDIAIRTQTGDNNTSVPTLNKSDRGSNRNISLDTVTETRSSKQPGTAKPSANECPDDNDNASYDSDTITVYTSPVAPTKPVNLRTTSRSHTKSMTTKPTTKTQHNRRTNNFHTQVSNATSQPAPMSPHLSTLKSATSTPHPALKNETQAPRHWPWKPSIKRQLHLEPEKQNLQLQLLWDIIGMKGTIVIGDVEWDIGDFNGCRFSGCD